MIVILVNTSVAARTSQEVIVLRLGWQVSTDGYRRLEPIHRHPMNADASRRVGWARAFEHVQEYHNEETMPLNMLMNLI